MKNNIIIISCKESTEFVEKKTAGSLSLLETLKMKIHLLICSSCNTYYKTSNNIEKGISNLFNKPPKEMKLSNKHKSAILRKIDKSEK